MSIWIPRRTFASSAAPAHGRSQSVASGARSNELVTEAAHPAVLPAWVTQILGYGMAVLPVVGAVVPFGLSTGTASRIVAALLLALIVLAAWMLALVATRRVFLVQTPVNVPIVLVGLVWILSCLASNAYFDPRVAVRLGVAFTAVQVAAVTVTLVSLGLVLLGANLERPARFAQVATWGILAVGYITGAAYYLNLESRLSFIETTGLFTLWVVALSYGQAIFNDRLHPLVRLGLLGLTAAYLLKSAILQTYWLSGWMPAVAAVGVITFLRSLPLFGVGVLTAATAAIAYQDRIYRSVFESNLDEGSASRIDIWLQAWDLVSQYPILGTGPAGYAAYYMTFFADSGSSMSTHSNYVDIVAQTGIIGSLAFLALLVALGVVAFKACQRWRRGFEGGFVAAATGGLVGAGVAMSLGDWVLPFVYNQGIGGFRYTVHTWVFLGLLAGFAVQPGHRRER